MKKAISLILVLVLSLSLCACGGGSDAPVTDIPTMDIVGVWNLEGKCDVFVFSDDGKVACGDEEFNWWYDENVKRYCLSIYGLTYTFVIEQDDHGRFFAIGGDRLYYVENYDPEAIKAAFIKEQIASLTEGKTELVVGNTYTTESGVDFTFEKAEITGDDSCFFHLYFTYEGSLEVNKSAGYKSFNGESGFGMDHQKDDCEGSTHHYGGYCLQEKSSLEADKDAYGFLTFSIEETTYYVPINTFFE